VAAGAQFIDACRAVRSSFGRWGKKDAAETGADARTFPRNLLSREFERRPHEFYRAWRADGPVLRFEANNAWVVLDYDAAQSVLKDTTHFSSAVFEPLTSPLLHASDPPEHTHLRRNLAPFFTPARQAALGSTVDRVASELAARIAKKRKFAVLADFADLLPLAVACEWLGVESGFASRCLLVPVGTIGWDEFKAAVLPNGLIAELKHTGIFTESELSVLTAFFLSAAISTSRDFIWLALRALVMRPADLGNLRSNPGQIGSAMEELLRLEPPVHALLRIAGAEADIAGDSIAKGGVVWISIAAANRDASKFERPDEIVYDRNGPRHLAFGSGAHFCLGSHLARMFGNAAVKSLLPLLDCANREFPLPELRFQSEQSLPIVWRLSEWVLPVDRA
jgi:cytochrome P450